MGRDGRNRQELSKTTCFNPRARMGRDGPYASTDEAFKSFNPRARMGRDCALSALSKYP